jgi:hypothetical protein
LPDLGKLKLSAVLLFRRIYLPGEMHLRILIMHQCCSDLSELKPAKVRFSYFSLGFTNRRNALLLMPCPIWVNLHQVRFSFSPDLHSRRDALKNSHFTSMLLRSFGTVTSQSAEPQAKAKVRFSYFGPGFITRRNALLLMPCLI